MTALDDDVDFNNLAKEVDYALAKDEKYQRENDAKFRAIHQKVKSYDEFRDIVAASHLKALDKTDKIGGMSYQKWNQLANSTSTKSDEVDARPDTFSVTSYGQPNNFHEFSKVWKRICSDSKDRFAYLVSIEAGNLRKFLESDCLLGDIVTALHSSLDLFKDNFCSIIDILNAVASTGRFSLALDFLSSDEQTFLQNIFDTLLILSKEETENFETMLHGLCTKYKVKAV